MFCVEQLCAAKQTAVHEIVVYFLVKANFYREYPKQ